MFGILFISKSFLNFCKSTNSDNGEFLLKIKSIISEFSKSIIEFIEALKPFFSI